MTDFPLDEAAIRASLLAIAASDDAIRVALDQVGFPPVRRRPVGLATLVRIIVGQQVSVAAAATIYGRLEAATPITADALLAAEEAELRAVGLSGRKVTYVRALAQAVTANTLDLDGLASATDGEVVEQITAVKGLGVWSAEIYLMFALGRKDVWPAGDLAVRASAGKFSGLVERPTVKEAVVLAEPWRPHRSAVALLCWHYANNPPA